MATKLDVDVVDALAVKLLCSMVPMLSFSGEDGGEFEGCV